MQEKRQTLMAQGWSKPLFSNMDDTTIVRMFTKARTESTPKDVMRIRAEMKKERMIYPTTYKKVK